MPDDERVSTFREALQEQRALVVTARQLMIEYIELCGHPPSTEWLLKKLGLTH